MTKKILLLVFTYLAAGNLFAQKLTEGSLESLIKDEVTIVNFELDFSNASIYGLSESSYGKYNPKWEEWKNDATLLFVTTLSEHCAKYHIKFDKTPEVETTFRVTIDSIYNGQFYDNNRKGNCKCSVVILNAEKQIVARIINIRGAGGKVGSSQNLMNDGIKRAAEQLGDFLTKKLKKVKKSSK